VLQQPVLLYLGKVSFGLYLLHLPVLLLLASWLSPTWPLPVTCVLALGVSVGLADVLHRGVERPGIAWGRALSRWWRVAPDARRAPGIS
jgi:peptidoglycan/LPS O-acetylase OafA/YrhL